MLERDHRRDRRHLRRAPQDLGAVDDVHAHDLEFGVGQLVGLVQDFGRRAHLADVVHQRGQTQLAQRRAVDAERPRLRHGQHRDVDHVRERVVVVVLQRRQGDQRGAIRRHRLRERIDERARRFRIGRAFGLRHFPHRAGEVGRIRVQPADRGDVGGRLLLLLFGLDAADANVRQAAEHRQRIGGLRRRRRPVPAGAPGARSSCASVCSSSGVTPRSKAMRSMPSAFNRRIISPIVSAAFGSGMSPTMISWPMMPIAIDGCSFSSWVSDSLRRVERALHERMRRRVELRAAQRGAEPLHEIVGVAQPRELVRHYWFLRAAGRAGAGSASAALAILRTPPGPDAAASSSTRSALG